jgi:hypothetical protein
MRQHSLVSVTFVYFAGGVVVQKFYFKREGLEIIPNSVFWLALPGLVKVLVPQSRECLVWWLCWFHRNI